MPAISVLFSDEDASWPKAHGQKPGQYGSGVEDLAPPLTCCDASYLALAVSAGAQSVTDDDEMAKAAGKVGVDVITPT